MSKFVSQFPLPRCFDMLQMGDCEVGWALRFSREELNGFGWRTAVIGKWAEGGVFADCTKAHVKYIWSTLSAEGVHVFPERGEHFRDWDWDWCTHPSKTCPMCDVIFVISHPEMVDRYGNKILRHL